MQTHGWRIPENSIVVHFQKTAEQYKQKAHNNDIWFSFERESVYVGLPRTKRTIFKNQDFTINKYIN